MAPNNKTIKVIDASAPKAKPANGKPHGHGLVSFNKMDPETRRKVAAEGGRKSGEVRRQNKTFKQALEWFLEMPAIKGNVTVDQIRQKYPTLSNREAMAIAMVSESIKKQDIKAFLAIRDTTGELPEQTINVKNEKPMCISVRVLDDDDTTTESSTDADSESCDD